MDSYTIYCQWCAEHNHKPPTRAWWEMVCNQPRTPKQRLSAVQADVDTERREGWGYGS